MDESQRFLCAYQALTKNVEYVEATVEKKYQPRVFATQSLALLKVALKKSTASEKFLLLEVMEEQIKKLKN